MPNRNQILVDRLRDEADLCRNETATDVASLLDEAADRIAQLGNLLWSPVNKEFTRGVIREAGHQVERWGSEHDAGKEPQDWFWLIGYLAGKALHAAINNDKDKALHHCISTAAVCANWHVRICESQTAFRPGLGSDGHEAKPNINP